MKLLLLIALSAVPGLAQTPDCTYTLGHSRPGALAIFRNGGLLQPADYTRSGSLGRVITLNGWNDQDQITYSYPYASDITVPGTSPAFIIRLWISTLEYHSCAGTQNPPPAPIVFQRMQCQGSVPPNPPTLGYACDGIELWKITAGSQSFTLTAFGATPEQIALPQCTPGFITACWNPVPNDAPPVVRAFLNLGSRAVVAYGFVVPAEP